MMGLDYLLTHFKEDFPRHISTFATKNKQIVVSSKQGALCQFEYANYLNCKIRAYPSFVEWKGVNIQAPDLIFVDLDLSRFVSKLALDRALDKTCKNIKDRLGGYPSVIWSGHGFHIYQPVEAFVLEEESIFNKFEQPSRRFIQFAEQYLSDRKSDRCHSYSMSFKNCMLRVPGSFNSKSESEPPVEVKIIQKWDGSRPSIKPLLCDFYIYLQDLKLKKILQHKHQPNEVCKYWRTKR